MGYLKEKYTKKYFLGSIDQKTGKTYGVAGFEDFKSGHFSERYKMFLGNFNLKNKIILDIGCGRGEVVDYCARRGAGKVIGIDFSKDAIQIASEFNRNSSNAELIEMEAKDLNFKNMFDVVFVLDVIEHIPDQEMQLIYPRIYSALKKGGVLILYTPLFKSTKDKDSSDFIPATSGMHCNKQTKEKLNNDLIKYRFRKYSLNVWGRSSDKFSLSLFLYGIKVSLGDFLIRQFDRISHSKRTLLRSLKRLFVF